MHISAPANGCNLSSYAMLGEEAIAKSIYQRKVLYAFESVKVDFVSAVL